MKIEMHTHCRPVSTCAHHQPEDFPKMLKNAGIDGCVLTNHYSKPHMDTLSDDLKEQAKIYVDTFERAKQAGEEIGFKVFFGCELKLITQPHKPEFLLYGLTIEDFLETYPLYNEDQKTVFYFCNEKNIVMIQAHPYRMEQGYFPADMNYVHGVEVYNPHPLFSPRVEESLKLADENRLIKTIGSDFHEMSQAGNTAMIFPDDTENVYMICDYLRNGKATFYVKDKSIILH